jgi:hypothetical protein
MNCDAVQALLSEHMDGEYLTAAEIDSAQAHAAGCRVCSSFQERSGRVRTAVRIRPAEPIPDLTGPIMAAVVRERTRSPWGRHAGAPRRARARRSVRPARLLAAALAGMLVGSVVVGGPWQRTADPMAAAAVARTIRDVASSIEAFRGSYRIDERGLSADVPQRHLEMEVAFLAPQRFRLDVHDLTTYPSTAWTPTNLTYVEDMPATYREGPTGCPGDLAPGVCPPTRATVTRVSEFSAASPLPADLIVPIATFASARGVRVAGEERMLGRTTLRVELSFARAAPLFPFLRLGGTWRPFFAGDRVTLWLDTSSWYPVRYEVAPSADPARRAWEMRFGLAPEPQDVPVLVVTAEEVGQSPPASLFAIPGLARPNDVPLADAPERLGYTPATLTEPGRLGLVSLVAQPASPPGAPRSVIVYADGLDYLRLAENPDWHGSRPFGSVDAGAEEVVLPRGGVGFYEPAGDGQGRRLAIHSADTDLYLETNLARAELFSLASSIPVRGEELPSAWRSRTSGALTIERIAPRVALSMLGVGLPPELPDGYVTASAQRESKRSRVVGLTLTFRQRDTDAAGPPLTLHVEPHAGLPAASSAAQSTVTVGSVTGRWTPSRSLLEWSDRDSYRSLSGEIDLRALVSIAASTLEWPAQ